MGRQIRLLIPVSLLSSSMAALYQRHVTLLLPELETYVIKDDKNGERRATPFPRNNVNSIAVRAVTRSSTRAF